MKTYFDCIPCFYRQAVEATRIANLTEDKQKQIIIELSKNVEKFLSGYSPPEVARMVYDIINKHIATGDVYKSIKEQNNEFALKLYPKLKQKIIEAEDMLLPATELAIAGNVIDFGAKNSLDVTSEINKIINSSSELLHASNKKIFDYEIFKNKIYDANSILYVADNAGEVVFDKLLIETIKTYNPNIMIYYAVKEKPIINDALMQDAIQCGIDKIATVISSGSVLSGTLLFYCNEKFIDLFNAVDVVISKGQGNFEGLHQATRDIFFLFIAKCQVIANMIKGNIGNIILFYKK